MNFKLNALVAAAIMAASAPALAVMQGATSGNGELLLNLRYYDGAANAGGNDISAVFDLGVTMDDFLANRNTAGFNMTWDLRAANYGSAFDTVLAFIDGLGGNRANIEYNVIALDNTDKSQQGGGSRYMTTAAPRVNIFPALSNSLLNAWDGMDVYVDANNKRGTHPTQANGASTAVQADGSAVNPTYFGSVVGSQGDTWRVTSPTDTTAKVGVAQNFWFLTTSSLSNTAQSDKRPFGVDFNGNSGTAASGNKDTLELVSSISNTGTEFGRWSFAVDASDNPLGTISFANPVPEAKTYAMMLAGLGLVGFMARRRMNRMV